MNDARQIDSADASQLIARTLAQHETEWRWSAGVKALGDNWGETVEEAERTHAQGIVEYIAGLHHDDIPVGGRIVSAIVERMHDGAAAVMEQITQCVEGVDPEGDPGEVLVRALCESHAVREHYLRVVERLRRPETGSSLWYQPRSGQVKAVRYDGTNAQALREAMGEQHFAWSHGPFRVSTREGMVAVRNDHWIVHGEGSSHPVMMSDAKFRERYMRCTPHSLSGDGQGAGA